MLFVASLVVVPCVAAAAQVFDLPSPLDGPGVPDLKRKQIKRIEKAEKKLAAGDMNGAAKVLRKVRDTPAGELLDLQLELALETEPPIQGLSSLCAAEPEYAAAWATLAQAQENGGDELGALRSARRVTELWPDSKWAGKTTALEQEWVTGRIDNAQRELDAGDAERALELTDSALSLDPDNPTGNLVKARALLALDQDEAAEAVLVQLSESPEARWQLGTIAEGRGDLFAAMQYYESLPEDMEQRKQSLSRVKLEWRKRNLPDYVQTSLASEQLTREELAAILVGLVPEAHALGGGDVPLLSDILESPSRKEIVTVVRLGLMDVDTLQHHFDPTNSVSPAEAMRAIDRLALLLDVGQPRWCSDSAGNPPGCVDIDSPVRGEQVANVIIRTTHGESQ
jgi:tetratricopeptide (TPR) repeat protein